MVGDLGERIEAVDRREDLAAFLGQERLGGTADGLAVVDDQDLQSLSFDLPSNTCCVSPATPSRPRVV